MAPYLLLIVVVTILATGAFRAAGLTWRWSLVIASIFVLSAAGMANVPSFPRLPDMQVQPASFGAEPKIPPIMGKP